MTNIDINGDQTPAVPRPYWLPNTQGFLAIAIIGVVSALAFILIGSSIKFDDKVAGAFMTLLGVLTACLKDVYSFFFGSSRGSEKKDDALISGQVSPTSTPPIVPPAQAINSEPSKI